MALYRCVNRPQISDKSMMTRQFPTLRQFTAFDCCTRIYAYVEPFSPSPPYYPTIQTVGDGVGSLDQYAPLFTPVAIATEGPALPAQVRVTNVRR